MYLSVEWLPDYLTDGTAEGDSNWLVTDEHVPVSRLSETHMHIWLMANVALTFSA